MVDNRSPDKIENLLEKFSSFRLQSFQDNNEPIDLLINATSVALSGAFHWNIQNELNEETIFYDLSYNKIDSSTPFLSWASQYSDQCHSGIGMLINQAALSFELWTGIKPDINLAENEVFNE